MAMKTCMNITCATTSSAEWKTGWKLRSGELAVLCDKCGYAYEQRIYCEEFHSDDSGWRECVDCGKRLHCGCITSLSLIELLDAGGVKCIGCARSPLPKSIRNGLISKKHGLGSEMENAEGVGNHKDKIESNQPSSMLHSPNTNATSGMLKQDRIVFPSTEAIATTQPPPLPTRADPPVISGSWTIGTPWASTLAQTSVGSFLKDRRDGPSSITQNRNDFESIAQPNLNISLCAPGKFQFTSGIVIKDKEQRKTSNAFSQGFIPPSLAPTPPKLPVSPAPNSNMNTTPQSRVAKSPFEGRGRHQLLPRYWPRITEQELQQISGDPNCTITPLFEKVLSASDAGRIGRLVLPKACAEAYFPPISQSEGLPIKIQDIKGKEWVFQFRFWPNNNSRMYVLEGVTPCIQSMQLQAGDTVTFSRKDPEGKLIMGFRKASPSMQDMPVTSSSTGLPQSLKGSTDSHMNSLSRQLDSACNVNLVNGEKLVEPAEGGLLTPPVTMTEKKKGRNIGAKGKRLLIDNQDVQALKLTWEEVQGMLRPPPNAMPNVVEIDGFEIEEYDEPPVIGKSSVFGAHPSGLIDQWVQCDGCSKWRRLPADILIPPKWTCADNSSDPARCFCSAPDELSPEELEKLSNLSKDSKKKRAAIADRVIQEQESSGLSALANAAGLGVDPDEAGTSTAAITTKHPRHRPGCSCIVCIQPPSGKGKHDSTCTCTVCMTVKRRFRTLMMRKKKRQSNTDGGAALKTRRKKKSREEDDKADVENDETNIEMDSLLTELTQIDDDSVLDLNDNPELEENSNTTNGQADLTSLLHFVKQNSLTFWAPEEQANPSARSSQMAPEIEGERVEEHPVSQAAPEEQVNPSEGSCEEENTDKLESNPQ